MTSPGPVRHSGGMRLFRRHQPPERRRPRPYEELVTPWGEPQRPPPAGLLAATGLPDAPLRFLAHVADLGDVWAIHPLPPDPLGAWHRLTVAHPQTGWCPVLLASFYPDFHDEQEATGSADLPEDGRTVLDRLRTTVPTTVVDRDDPWPPVNDKPLWVPPDGMLALLPTPHPWVAPLALGYLGAANLGVEPWEHAAVLRLWHEHFGARVHSIDEAELVLHVPQPPTDPHVALAVAWDHAYYCPDEVEGSPVQERTEVTRSHVWRFFWD